LNTAKTFLISLASSIVFWAVLLLSAGRMSYWPAWVYAAVGLIMNGLTRVVLRRNPDLAAERTKPGMDAKAWDKRLLGLGLLLTLATLIVAGLDSGRCHWAPHLTWQWSVTGLLLDIVGMTVFLAALNENRFFSAVVRIQRDRGHTVCASGPYRIVRHPGNGGMVIGTLGLPLLLMSAWSLIPTAMSVAVIILRTQLEDAVLATELDGYRAYQFATRYRLVPGIW
jgi:protein-S-isoprenylcysteine O-methyltransferase Ste14